jgi:hypothetical protein
MKSTFGDLSNSSKNKGLNLLDFKPTGLEPKKLMNFLDLSGFITDLDLQFEVQLFSEGYKNVHNCPYGFEIYLVNVKIMRTIAHLFVAFSEKLNFTPFIERRSPLVKSWISRGSGWQTMQARFRTEAFG